MNIRELDLGEIIVNALYGLFVVAITALAIGFFVVNERCEKIQYEKALQYAERHETTCLSSKGSLAFVFANGAIIGRSAILDAE